MPRNRPRDTRIPEPPVLSASAAEVEQGRTLYNRLCLGCHGTSVASSLIVPDLRQMTASRYEAFESIVLGGALAAKGMPSFAELLTPADLAPLRAYIVSRARKAFEAQAAAGAEEVATGG
jgi:quinohemoprotein ethanol dehydrogenase